MKPTIIAAMLIIMPVIAGCTERLVIPFPAYGAEGVVETQATTPPTKPCLAVSPILPIEDMLAFLQAEAGEHVVWSGVMMNQYMWFMTADEVGSWSIVVAVTDSSSCIVAYGETVYGGE